VRRVLRRDTVEGWLLLLPAMVFLVAFTHWPVVATLIDSLYSTPKARRPSRFVGLDNYEQMVGDPVFWKAATNNLWFALGTIPVAVSLALLMAVLVNDRLRGQTWVRMAFFTPTILPLIAVANIWLFFYTPQYGLLAQLLGLFGFPDHNWLGSQSTALACVTAVAVWKEAGFFMLFYLAALQQLPPQLAEAAALEGASRWTYLRRVQLPLLMPTTLFVLVNAVINAFRMVDHIVVLTKGGPDNASTLLLYHIYQVGFSYWDTGYAAALTVVLLAVLATIAALQYGVLERRIHYR
jgi:sn-glycerol 3-phosphate transport system permease protein